MSSQEEINGDSSPESQSTKPATKESVLLQPKPQKKIIRVLTVLAYVLSVSMAAILLSIYYIFIWESQPHLGARKTYPNHNSSSISYTLVLPNFTNISGTEEMRQQIEVVPPPTTSSVIEENTTWFDSDVSSETEELSKESNFIKKIIYHRYPYGGDD